MTDLISVALEIHFYRTNPVVNTLVQQISD
jgi:hypothetical protein